MTTSHDTAWAAVEITESDLGGRCLEFFDDTDLARRVFYDTFGDSTNFVTPEVVSYHLIGPYAVELSKGSAIIGDGELWGVTVLECDGQRTDLSQSFQTDDDALRYMGGLA